MNIKNYKQIEKMRKSGQIAATILEQLINSVKPGVTTMDIELLSQKLIDKHQVIGAFKNYNAYPFNTCISVNDQIVHGLPGKYTIKEGDIVSIDFGVIYGGFYSDVATTIGVGNISKKAQDLLDVTKKSLDMAIDMIKPGVKLGNIQHTIGDFILSHKLGLVKELTGHGIGSTLQESPTIPNYAKPDTGIILKPGMTFCIEPMVTLGNGNISLHEDGWTIVSQDKTLSAHFEHTLLVSSNGCEILTQKKS